MKPSKSQPRRPSPLSCSPWAPAYSPFCSQPIARSLSYPNHYPLRSSIWRPLNQRSRPFLVRGEGHLSLFVPWLVCVVLSSTLLYTTHANRPSLSGTLHARLYSFNTHTHTGGSGAVGAEIVKHLSSRPDVSTCTHRTHDLFGYTLKPRHVWSRTHPPVH